jgi:hypothetical protein
MEIADGNFRETHNPVAEFAWVADSGERLARPHQREHRGPVTTYCQRLSPAPTPDIVRIQDLPESGLLTQTVQVFAVYLIKADLGRCLPSPDRPSGIGLSRRY